MTTFIAQPIFLSLKAIVFAGVILSQYSHAVPFTLSEELLRKVQVQHGVSAEQRLRDWQKMMLVSEFGDDMEKLVQVNGFVNRAYQIAESDHWRRSDDRLDPLEFLINHAGDGQDFTMTKLFTLYKMGMPLSKFRVGYVRVHGINQPHTVLAYFSTPDAEPLILDNLDKRIRIASLRTDLEPVYLFEAREILIPDTTSATLPSEKPSHVVKWQNLLPHLETVHY